MHVMSLHAEITVVTLTERQILLLSIIFKYLNIEQYIP